MALLLLSHYQDPSLTFARRVSSFLPIGAGRTWFNQNIPVNCVCFVMMVTLKGFSLEPAFLHAISVGMHGLFLLFVCCPREESSVGVFLLMYSCSCACKCSAIRKCLHPEWVKIAVLKPFVDIYCHWAHTTMFVLGPPLYCCFIYHDGL